MKFVLLKDDLFEKREGFHVGGNEIGALGGYFVVEKRELSKAVMKAQKIWSYIFANSGATEDFRAHIRFDFVPTFFGPVKKSGNVYDLGALVMKDLYEVNSHGPECMSCDSLFRETFPEIAKYTPSASARLAKRLYEEYKGQEITMVRGRGSTKDSWKEPLLKEVNSNGLSVVEMTEEEAVKKRPPLVWRWGNIDFNGEFSEYDNYFQRWLLKSQEELNVFNTVLGNGSTDIANKKLLATYLDIILDSKQNLEDALFCSKEDYVLKPLLGTSGKGIVFGEDTHPEFWRKALLESYKKGEYGIFKKVMLPRLDLERDVSITMDFLPSFFAEGSKLHYLYTVTRVEPWNSYKERKKINVLQGGGYGGTVTIEE